MPTALCGAEPGSWGTAVAPDHAAGMGVEATAASSFRTLPSLAQVPGARGRGTQELLLWLAACHGVRFAVDNKAQPPSPDVILHDRPEERAKRNHAL